MQAVNESIRRVREKPLPPPASAPTPQQRRKITLTPEELRQLAITTLANTERTIQALQDELSRMAGHIVKSDHCKPSIPDYHAMYSLLSVPIPMDESEDDESSSSSSCFSSSNEILFGCP